MLSNCNDFIIYNNDCYYVKFHLNIILNQHSTEPDTIPSQTKFVNLLMGWTRSTLRVRNVSTIYKAPAYIFLLTLEETVSKPVSDFLWRILKILQKTVRPSPSLKTEIHVCYWVVNRDQDGILIAVTSLNPPWVSQSHLHSSRTMALHIHSAFENSLGSLSIFPRWKSQRWDLE